VHCVAATIAEADPSQFVSSAEKLRSAYLITTK
jgi:hypothetical protein